MNPLTTLRELRLWIAEQKEDRERVQCPVCDQNVEVQHHKLGTEMAKVLLAMYHINGRQWINVPRLIRVKGGNYAKLRHWGFIEPTTDRRSDGNTTGWWRVTEAGEAWLRGGKAAAWANIYDGHLLSLDDSKMITLQEALKETFDWRGNQWDAIPDSVRSILR